MLECVSADSLMFIPKRHANESDSQPDMCQIHNAELSTPPLERFDYPYHRWRDAPT
jgi:hypothetical protein